MPIPLLLAVNNPGYQQRKLGFSAKPELENGHGSKR
jgi:hypothetical protein